MGIHFSDSSDNSVYHNNLVNNTLQVYNEESINAWDDGYPSGGNFWSDYGDRYPNATEVDASGVWNVPYVIDASNQDDYPLVPEFSSTLVIGVLIITAILAAVSYRRSTSSNRIPFLNSSRKASSSLEAES